MSYFYFYGALAYVLSCTKQEGLTLLKAHAQTLKLLSDGSGRDVFVWLQVWQVSLLSVATYTLLMDYKLGRTMWTESLFLLYVSPLVSIMINIYLLHTIKIFYAYIQYNYCHCQLALRHVLYSLR